MKILRISGVWPYEELVDLGAYPVEGTLSGHPGGQQWPSNRYSCRRMISLERMISQAIQSEGCNDADVINIVHEPRADQSARRVGITIYLRDGGK